MDRIGKYEVLDKIGSGGFAVVYKGYDPFIKRPVAIKVCYSRDEETRQRFFREAEVAGRLVHRNVTTIYDFGLHDQMPYLVEEYLPGEDLAHMIKRGEPETLAEKLDFLVQIAAGLDHAHAQGVIHRDIKPSNIRVLDDRHLKIMDFGTAKLADVESHLTQTGMTLGTVAYLPPERLLGRAGGPNSDLFSFGVLAYELLSFRRPFSARNIPALIDQVLNTEPAPLTDAWPEAPPELVEIVHKCLEKDPDRRYRSSREVLNELETFRLQLTTASLPVRDETSGSFAAPAELQLSGLLERARLAAERGRHDRALVFLDEVLEIAPDNEEARRLLEECRSRAATAPAEPSTAVTATTPVATGTSAGQEGAEDRRARKIAEAVASIEGYIRADELGQACDALRFATRLLGQFEQVTTLRDRMLAHLHAQVASLREEGRRHAAGIVATLDRLQGRRLLAPEAAEGLVAAVEDLDAANRDGRALLAALRRAGPAAGGSASARRARQEAEAVESIERLLAAGDADTAAAALRFARDMLGEFPKAPVLEQRISDTRRRP